MQQHFYMNNIRYLHPNVGNWLWGDGMGKSECFNGTTKQEIEQGRWRGEGDGGREEQRDGVMVCWREEGIISTFAISFAMVDELTNYEQPNIYKIKICVVFRKVSKYIAIILPSRRLQHE